MHLPGLLWAIPVRPLLGLSHGCVGTSEIASNGWSIRGLFSHMLIKQGLLSPEGNLFRRDLILFCIGSLDINTHTFIYIFAHMQKISRKYSCCIYSWPLSCFLFLHISWKMAWGCFNAHFVFFYRPTYPWSWNYNLCMGSRFCPGLEEPTAWSLELRSDPVALWPGPSCRWVGIPSAGQGCSPLTYSHSGALEMAAFE